MIRFFPGLMVIWVSLYTVEVYYLHPDLNDERKTSPYQVVFPSENWIPLPARPEERFFQKLPAAAAAVAHRPRVYWRPWYQDTRRTSCYSFSPEATVSIYILAI